MWGMLEREYYRGHKGDARSLDYGSYHLANTKAGLLLAHCGQHKAQPVLLSVNVGGSQNYGPCLGTHSKYKVPYYNRDPTRDHNSDNHPCRPVSDKPPHF